MENQEVKIHRYWKRNADGTVQWFMNGVLFLDMMKALPEEETISACGRKAMTIKEWREHKLTLKDGDKA